MKLPPCDHDGCPPTRCTKLGKVDYRPAKGGWTWGWDLRKCCYCQETYIGDKRSVVCADCAYKTKPSGPPEPDGPHEKATA